MPSYVDAYHGLQSISGASLSDAVLRITDGDLTVDFTQSEAGWFLLGPDGWQPGLAGLKGGGTYTNSAIADGQHLKHFARQNVTEVWQVGLYFGSPNGLLFEIDKLEELLKVRAPRYWTDRTYNTPVYIERSMAGETQTGYGLISKGDITLPSNFWDVTCNLNTGKCFPIQIAFNRQPFWLGAVPGQVQGTINLSALQAWNYNLLWAEEDTLPSGQVFAFGETLTGVIYAGGASEILVWNGTTWAVVDPSPVVLAADVTAIKVLANGDVLFGESGRIIKLAGGVWSVETTEPTGQVRALLEALDGNVYAGDNGRILKRDSSGTWAEDDDLPSGQVYSLAQTSSGRVFAGEVGRILQTADALTSETIRKQVLTGSDDAEEMSDGDMSLSSRDLDLFQAGFDSIGLRFQSLTIPQGATINSAVVRFTAEEDDGKSPGSGRIYCQDADTAATFTSTTNDITNRTLTTAYTDWTNETDWISQREYDTPDFSAAVQEVVDRAGWASGNHLVVIVNNMSTAHDRDAWTYDGKPGSASEIRITYTEARPGGETWEIDTTLPGGDVRSLLAPACGGLLAGEDGQILGSDDDGASWRVIDNSTATNEVRGLYDAGAGVIYGGDNGNILKSVDCGANWAVDSTLPTGYIEDLIKETSTGDIRAGDNGRILILDEGDSLNLGQSETENDQVFLANHHKTANLTSVFIDDGGVFSGIFPASVLPVTLLPAVPVVDDALYCGINTALADTGPFNNVVLDILTPASATTSYTLTWEYYNGSWVALTVQDGTNQLSEVGVNGIYWRQPADWIETTVNGVTGYFIRGRVSALTGTLTPPTQQNRNIYSAGTAFAELDDAEIEGVVEALVKAEFRCRSDNGGPGGSEPTLYLSRVLAGVKEVQNHTSFRAFLNFADEQNPTGVGIDVSVDIDSATVVQADADLAGPTGRRVFFDASTAGAGAGLNNLIDRVSITLATTIARDYYGTYKIFVRGKQTGGSAGDVELRVKAVSGSGGISSLTDIQATQSTTDHELIEFENPVTLPVSTLFTNTDIGDTTSLTVQISAASSSSDFYLYDMFLLPVGTMWIDSEDVANTSESAIENGTRLVVDSIDVPKMLIRTLVQQTGTGLYKANYRIDSNGPLSMLRGRQQRLWVMTARRNSVGGSVWLSEPEACLSVRAWKVERWLLGRGLT